MTDFAKRIEELSPEKRELLDMFLKEREGGAVSLMENHVAPRNPVEKTLTDIWQQALGVERVGINDNFFEIGGDSLHCIQIIAKARQAGLQITTNQLFERPTIAGLAAIAVLTDGRQSEQDATAGGAPMAVTPARPSMSGDLTPSDFPDAELSQDELDSLFTQ